MNSLDKCDRELEWITRKQSLVRFKGNVIKFAKLFLVLLELTLRGLTKETQFCVQIRCVRS